MNKARRKKPEKRKEWPAVVYFWAVGLDHVGYIAARWPWTGGPPYHGSSPAEAARTSWWMWYRWRGDIFRWTELNHHGPVHKMKHQCLGSMASR
jgi:hypothetical protein